jgi:hypothetical protein
VNPFFFLPSSVSPRGSLLLSKTRTNEFYPSSMDWTQEVVMTWISERDDGERNVGFGVNGRKERCWTG